VFLGTCWHYCSLRITTRGLGDALSEGLPQARRLSRWAFVALIHPRNTSSGFADILWFVFLLIGVLCLCRRSRSARGPRSIPGRTARRRDADRASSAARSPAGDMNRCRVISAALTRVPNRPGPSRRDNAGLVAQRLVTAWARVATIERGPSDVARHGAARADHVGHGMQARSRRWPHQARRSVQAIRRTDGGEDRS
jgi:hypothetical protein